MEHQDTPSTEPAGTEHPAPASHAEPTTQAQPTAATAAHEPAPDPAAATQAAPSSPAADSTESTPAGGHEPPPTSADAASPASDAASAASPAAPEPAAAPTEAAAPAPAAPAAPAAGADTAKPAPDASTDAAPPAAEGATAKPTADDATAKPAADAASTDAGDKADKAEPAKDKDFAQILAEFESDKGAAQPAEAGAGGGKPAAGGAGAAGGSGTPGTPRAGQKVSGKIHSIAGDQVFVDLGLKSEGMIEAAQLRDAEGNLTVNVGDAIDATVTSIDPESGVIVLRKKASGGRGGQQEVATELRQAFQYGMPVEGMVTGINKGGAEVQVYNMRAFCPLSQLDLRYVENPQQFIGQRLKFKVSRIEEGGRNRRPDIVLSRRALLEEEAQSKATELRARLNVGAVLKGRVTSLTTYGAFIDLGGLEGLLHVSEIGYSRLADPREALTVGQEVEVQVIKIEKGKDEKRPERISLSRRSLERDPWRDAAQRFTEGSLVQGRVMRLESFGAFVELSPGLEGLVHVSELGAGRRLNHAREAVQVGQDVKVRVLNVDPVKRRISLSMGSDADSDREPADDSGPRDRADRGDRGERGDRGDRGDRDRGDRGDRDSGSASAPPTSFGSLGDFFNKSGKNRRQ